MPPRGHFRERNNSGFRERNRTLVEEFGIWLGWAEVYFEAEPDELKVTDLLPGDRVHVDGYLLTVASVTPSYFGEYRVEVAGVFDTLRLDAGTRLTLVRSPACE